MDADFLEAAMNVPLSPDGWVDASWFSDLTLSKLWAATWPSSTFGPALETNAPDSNLKTPNDHAIVTDSPPGNISIPPPPGSTEDNACAFDVFDRATFPVHEASILPVSAVNAVTSNITGVSGTSDIPMDGVFWSGARPDFLPSDLEGSQGSHLDSGLVFPPSGPYCALDPLWSGTLDTVPPPCPPYYDGHVPFAEPSLPAAFVIDAPCPIASYIPEWEYMHVDTLPSLQCWPNYMDTVEGGYQQLCAPVGMADDGAMANPDAIPYRAEPEVRAADDEPCSILPSPKTAKDMAADGPELNRLDVLDEPLAGLGSDGLPFSPSLSLPAMDDQPSLPHEETQDSIMTFGDTISPTLMMRHGGRHPPKPETVSSPSRSPSPIVLPPSPPPSPSSTASSALTPLSEEDDSHVLPELVFSGASGPEDSPRSTVSPGTPTVDHHSDPPSHHPEVISSPESTIPRQISPLPKRRTRSKTNRKAPTKAREPTKPAARGKKRARDADNEAEGKGNAQGMAPKPKKRVSKKARTSRMVDVVDLTADDEDPSSTAIGCEEIRGFMCPVPNIEHPSQQCSAVFRKKDIAGLHRHLLSHMQWEGKQLCDLHTKREKINPEDYVFRGLFIHYPCKHCGKKFSRSDPLHRHMRESCTEAPQRKTEKSEEPTDESSPKGKKQYKRKPSSLRPVVEWIPLKKESYAEPTSFGLEHRSLQQPDFPWINADRAAEVTAKVQGGKSKRHVVQVVTTHSKWSSTWRLTQTGFKDHEKLRWVKEDDIDRMEEDDAQYFHVECLKNA